MKDEKLREAFRALVRYLNLSVYDNFGYSVSDSPPYSSCNIARRRDVVHIQEQIDELKKKVNKKRR